MSADAPIPPTDDNAAIAGHVLGRYRLRSRVARGGMAEIFLGETSDVPGVQRTVIIKRLLPELARDPEHGRMFLDEARIMASLVHPNVVQVVEVGREGDELFIAMERIDGVSLSALMEAARGTGAPLPLDHGVHLVHGVLAGLHYVHERRGADGRPMQLVHRDVSPRNVLVTWEGGVKLIDFGIARQGNRLGQTRSGVVKGTIPYMSPEQCRGLHLDRRTDVFSTGILLFELTTGQRLFAAESDYDVLRRIVEGEIERPGRVVPGYPEALEQVVMRALARAPADRFQSAGEMLDALESTARRLGLAPSARALESWLAARFVVRGAGVAAVAGEAETSDGGTRPATAVTGAAGVPSPVEVPESVAANGGSVASASVVVPRTRGRSMAVALTVGAAMVGLALVALRRGPAPAPAPVVPVAAPSPAPTTAPALPPPAPLPAATPAPVPVPAPTAAAAPAPPAPHPPSAVRGRRPPHASPSPPAPSENAPTGAPSAPSVTPTPPLADGEGELVLDAHPWCEVFIDGARRGETPLLLKVPAGPHTVRLRNEEFDIERTVTLTVERNRALRRTFTFPASGAR